MNGIVLGFVNYVSRFQVDEVFRKGRVRGGHP
jgi:hypothetical protein